MTPAQVEAHLVRHPNVAEAAILERRVDGDGSQFVAYVVGHPGVPPPTAEQTREFLRPVLPESLLPGFVEAVPELPRTPAGTLDRAALAALPPEPHRPAGVLLTDMERRLAAHWAETLKLSTCHRDTDFFECGGHSLLGAVLAARTSRTVGYEVPLTVIFDHPTLAEFAAAVEALAPGGD